MEIHSNHIDEIQNCFITANKNLNFLLESPVSDENMEKIIEALIINNLDISKRPDLLQAVCSLSESPQYQILTQFIDLFASRILQYESK